MPFPKFEDGNQEKRFQDNTFDMFPIGTRVRVASRVVDFCFFRCTETGRVIRNKGKYLGIIVKFDEPMVYEDGFVRTEHNFRPQDLERIGDPCEDCNAEAYLSDLNHYMAIG